VTGGAGFVGSHIADHYASQGHEVIALDNFSRFRTLGKFIGDPTYNMNWLQSKHKKIRFVKTDITRGRDVSEQAREVDIIFHTAGQVAVTTSVKNPLFDFKTNVVGTLNVLEAARRQDSMVLFCSTNKVYGDNVNDIAVKAHETRYEFDDPLYTNGIPEDLSIDLCAHSPYGCSKLCADEYVQEYGRTYGLKAGIFRMSCIYGERQFGLEDQGWIAWFAIATLTDKLLTIYGDGKQVRDVLYVGDLVKAFDSFVKSKLGSEVFNVGGGKTNTLSLIELLQILKDLTGREPRTQRADWRPHDQKVYISDLSKAKKKLQWRPNVAPKEGISRLVKWTLANRRLFEDAKSSN
jgi:CDP-paratose 2-epimerase